MGQSRPAQLGIYLLLHVGYRNRVNPETVASYLTVKEALMPLPTDLDWTVHDVFDRGKAEFFHGRESILRTFHKECARAVKTNGGTTILIEGAPGAGKSAVLSECADRAARNGWFVATRMVPSAFSDVTQMRKQMGQLRYFQVKDSTFGFKALMGLTTISSVTRPVDALGKDGPPLLLVLDEAQYLRTLSARAIDDDARATAIETILLIHNGLLQRPLMLLAGGLGTTTKVFSDLGISRFGKRRRVELGSMKPEAERALLHDWMTLRAKAQGDPTPWIDAIMRETHGWPHHIMSYVDGVMEHLPDADGVMSSQRLQRVLASGREGCTEYYLERTDDFNAVELAALVGAFPSGQPGATTSYQTIMASLAAAFPARPSAHQQDIAARLFDRALEKGVLSKQGSQYVIPIPSMHSWLEREFGSH